MAWLDRLWNLVKSRELDDGLDEELQFHLEARIQDNIREGMTPAEARRDAILRFGNRTLAKERTRESDTLRWLDEFVRDIGYGIRTLRHSPGFTAVAVLVMALGIGVNTAVFTIVNGVLLRPLPFPDSSRLQSIAYAPAGARAFGPSMIDHHYLEFRRHDQKFAAVASFTANPVTLTGAGEPVRLAGFAVTTEFLDVLRVKPLAGRSFLPDEGAPGANAVVLLSDELWQQRFRGDLSVVGKPIQLDGVAHTVIGIMPAGFGFPSGAQLWTPFEVRLQTGNSFARPVIGRLKDGVTEQQAQAALAALASALPLDAREKQSGFEARVRPLKDLVVADVRSSLFIFSGAVGFVLLIACANVANLLLIRAAARRHEIAVRTALGAGRWRLIRQLLTESLLVSMAGGVAGTLLAAAAAPALLALAPEGKVPRVDEIGINFQVLAFTAGLSVLTGLLFGLAPALRVTRGALRQSLADAGRASSGRREGLRSALVVSEIALALVLLTGAGLLLKSFWRIQSQDPGFRPQNVTAATVNLPDSRYGSAAQMRVFHQTALAKLASLPGVEAAGAVNWVPLGPGLMQGDFKLDGGRTMPARYVVDKLVVSPEYFRAIGIRILQGRAFTERDHADAPGVVIVSKSVASTLWPGEDCVGKRISMSSRPKASDWLTIVGVVDDIRQQDLKAKPSPALYQPYLQMNRPFFLSQMTFVVRASANPGTLAASIRGVIRETDPNQAVMSVTSMADWVAGTTAEPRFRARVLTAFSIMAMFLSAIGIYGVLACSIAERTREIGIRMALGANNGAIVWSVVRRTMLLAGVGVAIGTGGALAVTRVLEAFLFEVKANDPATYAAVAGLLVAVALFAGVLPARRAATVDPLIALRYE